MLDPSIRDRIRLVFHARCEEHWPEYTTQFNIKGDVPAARFLLTSGVPLVWFDTGAQLRCPMSETEKQLSPLGGMPAFLHDYRSRRKDFQSPKKGFFDLGDIAFLIQPDVCTVETVDVPHLGEDLKFERLGDLERCFGYTASGWSRCGSCSLNKWRRGRIPRTRRVPPPPAQPPPRPPSRVSRRPESPPNRIQTGSSSGAGLQACYFGSTGFVAGALSRTTHRNTGRSPEDQIFIAVLNDLDAGEFPGGIGA